MSGHHAIYACAAGSVARRDVCCVLDDIVSLAELRACRSGGPWPALLNAEQGLVFRAKGQVWMAP